ncbi:MAG: outer membrane lipid asymmetry maintenance protein MlaD [Opitutales bacterium]|jgi:phospholipid/cholesterol/gamma-HCH transport system substrate-binding protein|nr:outer membrane lipid asymmetry maintenance protein MlaD [Opitutales bacterium]
MNSKKVELTVGIFVLIGLIAILYLSLQVGSNRWAGDHYSLSARFLNAGGLNEGSSVQIAGVKVGTVGSITLNKEQMVAMVEIKLPTDLVLDDDTIASIKSTGLIGDKFLALNPGGSGIPLEAGEVIVDTESAVDIEDLISRFAFGSIEDE